MINRSATARPTLESWTSIAMDSEGQRTLHSSQMIHNTSRSQLAQLTSRKRSAESLYHEVKFAFKRLNGTYVAAMQHCSPFYKYSQLRSIIEEIIKKEIYKLDASYFVQSGMTGSQQFYGSDVQIDNETSDFSDADDNQLNSVYEDQNQFEIAQVELELFHFQQLYFRLCAEIKQLRDAFNCSRRRNLFRRYSMWKEIVETAITNTQPIISAQRVESVTEEATSNNSNI